MNTNDLMNIALNAKKNAYCNATGYQVGAALLTSTGTVYIGVNIEEQTIPNLSNCAERVAIQNAISHGEISFESIAIVGGKKGEISKTLTPCGVCLQYILDMCKNVDIICYINEKTKVFKVKELLNVPYELETK